MPHVLRRSKLLLALVGCLASMAFGLMVTNSAQANWGNYCNRTLGGYEPCRGPLVYVNQAYGWGDQHSVCVGIEPFDNWSWNCSSGPGSGVYSAKLNEAMNAWPAIKNHAAGTNTVHGIYLFP
jgi:hypothetical protein